MIDYNYHRTPEEAQALLDRVGLANVLTFCQTHSVEIRQDVTGVAMLVNGEPWFYSCEMDAVSALIMGVHNYQKERKSPNP